jgi:site-specific recombinase XerD
VRRSHLARFARVMDPLDATETDLVRFMSAQQLAPESRKSYHASLRSFYRFALERGFIDEDPTLEACVLCASRARRRDRSPSRCCCRRSMTRTRKQR